jgi:hypothetical protein
VQVIKGVDIIKGEDLPELFDEQAVTVKFPLVLGCLALQSCSATAALTAAAEGFGTLGPQALVSGKKNKPNTMYQNHQNLIGNAIASTCSNTFTISSTTCNLSMTFNSMLSTVRNVNT